MSMSTNTGGLRQNLPKTFQDNAPNGGRPQMTTMPSRSLEQRQADYDNSPDNTSLGVEPVGFDVIKDFDEPMVPVDPGFNVNPVFQPGGSGNGKGGIFGPGITPGSPGGKSMPPMTIPEMPPNFGQPGEAPPDQGFIRSPKPTLPPQMQKPMPGPGYVGGIRTPPNNYRPPNQGGGILRSRRTGMPINR